MENPFKHFAEPLETGPNINSANEKILAFQQLVESKKELTHEDRSEVRDIIKTLQELQTDIDPSPESKAILAEIQVALTHAHELVNPVETTS